MNLQTKMKIKKERRPEATMFNRNGLIIPQGYFLRKDGFNMDQYGFGSSANGNKDVGESGIPQKKTLPQLLMPVIKVLRFLGALPLQFTASGMVSFNVVSWAMAYAVCAYTLMLVAMNFTFSTWFYESMKGYDFSMAMFAALAMILASEMVAVPVTYWLDARHLATLMSDWIAFQELYTRRTGKFLEFSLPRGRIITLAITITSILIVQETVYEFFFNECQLDVWNFRDIVVYCIIHELRNFSVLLLVLLCRGSKRAARSMLQHFQQDLERSARLGDTVSGYIVLWLELSRLSACIGTGPGYTFCYLIVYFVATITIYVYYVIFMVVEGVSGNFTWLACETTVSITLLFLICDGATGVYQQVRDSFQQYLLKLRFDPKYWNAHNEIDTFLRVMDLQPPVISLNGYATVNRGLLTSVGSLSVTYLVVLVQFRLSSTSSWKL